MKPRPSDRPGLFAMRFCANLSWMLPRILLLLTAIFFFSVSLPAQDVPVILNQPAAKMPKGSETVGLVGDIAVKVMVDKTGSVQSAEFMAGPGPACPTVTNRIVIAAREASKAAALKAKFAPNTALAGSAAATLNYPFGLPPTKPGVAVRLERIDRRAGIVAGEPYIMSASRAISLPKPAYPAAARAERLQGSVKLMATIDVDGTMLAAEPTSGHALLQAATRIAACRSRFMPTLVSGKPVKVRGIITYNFIP
jgi:hypothetical protein